MPRVLSWSLSFLAVSLAVGTLTVTWESHTLTVKAGATLANIDKTVGTVNTAVSTFNQTLVAINQPKYGIIAELDDNLKNGRLALDNLNAVAIKERFFLEHTQPEEVAKLNSVLDSTNVLIQTSTTNEKQLTEAALGAVQTTNVAVKELVPVEQNLATVATDVHKLVSDPSNQKTLANIQTATAAGAETAKEGQEWIHSLLHPTWPHKVYHVFLDLAHAFNPL